MFGKKVYELPLSREYVSSWGVPQAVRELLQNAIDSSAPFEYAQSGDSLIISSRGVRLDASTLVLGRTSKANDESTIGQFGEGYKLALLVLTREEKQVAVLNGGKCWNPEFRKSRMFEIDTLHIIESENETDNRDTLEFLICGLSDEEQNAITHSCLLMQPTQEDIIVTRRGNILPSRAGKLYVGGLYVCDTELMYGYDIKPGQITLERDRQTVDSWDLKSVTKDMWFMTEQYDRIAAMIDEGIPDVKYAEYSSTEMVREACYRLFNSRYPGHVIAKSQEELDELISKGMTKVVVVSSGAYYANISASNSYINAPSSIRAKTPHEQLTEWFDINRKYMKRVPIESFNVLLNKSKDWRLK